MKYSISQLKPAASVSTEVVAKPMPSAESTLLDTPIKGQRPRNLTRTTLLTSAVETNSSKYSLIVVSGCEYLYKRKGIKHASVSCRLTASSTVTGKRADNAQKGFQLTAHESVMDLNIGLFFRVGDAAPVPWVLTS